MNVLYRCTEYFTCELTRFLLWLESGKPAGLKMNLHLAHLMGQFFLYHILAWRSYVTFIIYLFMYILSVLKQLTEVNSFNVYFLANFTTIICLIFSTVYMLSSLYKEKMINLSLIKVFMIYFSTIIRLMLGLFACLLLDIIELMTLHLTSFYIYATHLLRLQSRTIAASWRLCRNSSKWNPLRNRVDKIPDMFIDPNELLLTISSLHKRISTPSSPSLISSSSDKENHLLQYDKEVENYSETPKSMEQRDMLYKFVSNKQNSDTLIDQLNKQTCGVYLDRLLVSTLLGLAIGLCLYSTTIAFYITFTCIQLFLLLIKNILKSAVWFIMDFPLESFLLWIFNSSYYQTKLILEAPRRDLKQCSFLRLKLTRIDFHEMYTQSHLIHKPLFPKRLSISELVYRLICAQDIR
ncbi:unnamed protein product [Heterobilharzia americana]|nr:unnamed protein product [Heterobilharzia americana]